MLIFALLATAAYGDYGPAPVATASPAAAMHELVDSFENCRFTARHRTRITRPAKTCYSITIDLCGWKCDKAVLIKSRTTTEEYEAGNLGLTGDPASTRWQAVEQFWTPGEQLLTVGMDPDAVKGWPATPPRSQAVAQGQVLQSPAWSDEALYLWDGYVLGDLLSGVDLLSGIGFVAILEEDRELGFRLAEARWASEDQESVLRYRYESKDYGEFDIWLKRMEGAWVPAQWRLVRGKDHLTSVSEEQSPRRLGEAKIYSGFTGKPEAADRLTQLYTAEYEGGRPSVLKKEETRERQSIRSTVVRTMELADWSPGSVSKASVQKAALEIPDGTEVLPTDEQRQRLRWVMSDGEMVKYVDYSAAEFASSLEFSKSNRRLRLTVTCVVVASLVGAIVYRRNAKQGA